MQATAVALTALANGSTEPLTVGMDGNVWRSAYGANGTFTKFDALSGRYGRPLGATSVAITTLPDGSTYTLAGAR